MNTILTDDERRAAIRSTAYNFNPEDICKAIEAAVLAKLREQEPVAWKHSATGMLYDTESEVPLADGDEWAMPLYAAPLPAVVQVPQGWRLEVDESAIYHNDKRIAVLEEDGGNQSWRDACALGQQIVDRMNAAHEAPAQADPMEKLTRIQEELGLYDDQPAQPIPAPWREAVKVAREALIAAEQDSADFQRVNVDEIRAALAQLDSLGGGE